MDALTRSVEKHETSMTSHPHSDGTHCRPRRSVAAWTVDVNTRACEGRHPRGLFLDPCLVSSSGRCSSGMLAEESGDVVRVRRDGHQGVTGPVHTFVKTDKHAHFKWGVRHHVGHQYAG